MYYYDDALSMISASNRCYFKWNLTCLPKCRFFFVVGILIFEFHTVWIFLRIRVFSMPSLIKQRNSLCNVCAYTFLIFTIPTEKTVCEAMYVYFVYIVYILFVLSIKFFLRLHSHPLIARKETLSLEECLVHLATWYQWLQPWPW